ncbi:response regulator [Gracilibacillus timonensis]|uniref:response regulator n=1 Tax=Gracilibacillus timonensis TaxID=1816696 RepID=UPI000824B3A7|nr:response regulator [Gracilibacillus timonensis]
MRALLFDDEPLALDFLEHQLKKTNRITQMHKFQDASIEQRESLIQQADIVFLDIEMPGINGLELAELIIEINPAISLVFVTAYDQYAIEAFKIHALDYLLKPVDVKRLNVTLKRIDYLIESQSKQVPAHKHLHIDIFQDLRFQFADETETRKIKWRTSKTKELFLYLLHQQGQSVLKSQLIELFWPDIELQKAYAQLYVTIYHIRKTLGSFNNHITITNIHDGYLLELHRVTVDRLEWEKQLKKDTSIREDTLSYYEDLLKTYPGSYLHNNDYIWLEAERYKIERIWLSKTVKLANYYFDHHQLDKAIEWYTYITEIKPDDETIAWKLMRLYASLNYGMLVHHHYKLLRSTLKDLDVSIQPSIRKWYQEWMES